jgi:hypothetical protein
VLADPRAAFHHCMCGLCGGATAVASMLIGYDDVEIAAGDDHEQETIVSDYLLYTDV